ncbi:MAG TPA: M13 family metallopeptidase [Candidatus Baltobacteraceae bacterium]|nr:M13 family metallopeptidase [Candidatus Baltobacteraceae bacterium]
MHITKSTALRLAAVVAAVAFLFADGTVRAAATKVSGIDLGSLDRTCKPCTDFYQFANGNWIKKNPIPAAYASWGSFNILQNHNTDVLHSLLNQASDAKAASGTNEQKIGDFYASCMDLNSIEGAGTAPLDPLLKSVAGITDTKSVAPVVAALQLQGVDAFFGFGSGADFKNSSLNIAQVGQSGLGLPDRDYYLKTDAKSKAIQQAYVAHMTTMFGLIGEAPAQAAADAQTVMDMETSLAKNQKSRVEERDPKAIYNPTDLAGLEKMAPNFDWASFMSGSGVTPSAINVAEPSYFEAFSTQLATWTPAQIQTYLRWHVVHAFAYALPQKFVDANFDFFSKTLSGTKEQLPRWKRCVRATDGALGEALGQAYVAKEFPPAAKARALELVNYVKATLHSDIGTLSWMSPATKQKAAEKLDAFVVKVGYPNKRRDYTNFDVTKGPYADNVIAGNVFASKYDYAKIGKAVDKQEWGMTPPTVNAYYNPTQNDINFPAGILQPPFFDSNADMAVNFGAIGAVIGHESTHGFDDQGRQFDKVGNLSDWWTATDAANFNKRSQCIVDQFDALSPVPGVHEQGKLVEGEAIADLGGLTIAYKAFERWQATHPRQTLDGFTPEQRFFLGWAHVWASNERPQYASMLATVDPHPYDKFRVNATLSNMPEFAKAWGCKLPAAMVRPAKDRCQIW